MRSIHGRLTVFLLVGTGLLLLVAGLFLDTLIRTKLEREFDRALLTKARTLVTLTTQNGGEVELDFADEFMPEFSAAENPEYFELWLADGMLIERSRSLGPNDLPRTNPPLIKPRFSDYRLLNGRPGRLVELMFVPHIKDQKGKEQVGDEATDDQTGRPLSLIQAVFTVARGRQDLDALIRSIRSVLAVTVFVLLGLMAALVRISINRGLQPLREITHKVKGLDARSLSTRVKVLPETAELTPIVTQLNNLLTRIDDVFQRQKQFSGDVAHELRTPLAEMRALAEVGAKWPEDTETIRRFFNDVAEVTREMETIVTNLLTLARCDAGRQQIEWNRIDLSSLIVTVWHRLDRGANKKQLELSNTVPTSTQVYADRDNLELILTNLLSNAIAYSPPNSSIGISTTRSTSVVEVAVTNIAPYLTREDLPRLCDRFWRKEQARKDGHHAGLGLAIVKALADLLNLELSHDLSADRKFKIALLGLTPADTVVGD